MPSKIDQHRRWLVFGAIAAIALLIANIAITSYMAYRVEAHSLALTRTSGVIAQLDQLMSLLKDAETGQRGYVITGKQSYLEPMKIAEASITSQLQKLTTATSDDPAVQAKLPDLRKHIEAKLAELDRTIALRSNDGFEAAQRVVLTDEGKNEMDAIRSLVGELTDAQDATRLVRSVQRGGAYRAAIITGLLSGLVALGAVSALFLQVRRYLIQRAKDAAIIADQHERLHITLQSIGDAVISTDTSGRVELMNEVAERLTGWKTADAIGQPLASVFNIVNEKTRAAVDNPCDRALREGVVVGLANHTIIIAKDGNEYPIDDSAAPIIDGRGAITGCVLVFRDVTERKQAERDLHEAEMLHRSFVEQVKDYAIYRTDRNGRAVTWNEGVLTVLGFNAQEFIGADIVQAIFTPEAISEGVPAKEMQTAAETGSANNDRWMRRKDGTRFWATGMTNAIRNESGELVGFAKVMRDSTDLKRARDALEISVEAERAARKEAERAGRVKDEFLTTLSHELRTPLNAILGWSHLLGKRNIEHDEELKVGLETIERNARTQTQLIEDLLDISRIVSGKLRLEVKPVDLQAVIDAACGSVAHAANAKEIQLLKHIDPIGGTVLGDAERLQQVLWNLLSNAVKFTPHGGEVKVSVKQVGTKAQIAVSDTGEGIAPEFLPHIFERFTQADASRSRRHGGLGLGLSIVKQLVDLHGGEVAVESAGLGKGTTFRIALPTANVHPDYSRASASTSIDSSANSKSNDHQLDGLKILIVDDDADARKLISKMLSDAGADARAAASAAEAMELLRANALDLLISDIAMPECDGYDLLRQVRAAGFDSQKLPAIAITAFARAEDREQSLRAGFQSHLGKPLELLDLINAIAELAGRG